MTYTVHGATGAQGSPVLAGLVAALEGSADAEVRAITRNPDQTFEGANTVVADNTSVNSLTDAYRAADGVFFHLPLAGDPETLAGYARNVLAAAKAARPSRFVISTSGTVIGDATSPLTGPNTPVLSELVDGLRAEGIAVTVLTPRLFLENLLLPTVLSGVKDEGVLRYPLRADLAVAWGSHLDVADAAVAALTLDVAPDAVDIGQIPAITGNELAEAFAEHFSRAVTFEAVTPEKFGASIAPIIGAGAATGVAQLYAGLATADNVAFDSATGSAAVLGINARNTQAWLTDLGVN
ncbi:NAD(P)H-binding protein [Rhodococcus sp. NPDC056516]|uniref:NmrA family NAD(P)-binding protein n=1 Tax=Rhodococcus sp. NPDC056516 TaxID=3345847 RepID=UPI00366B6BDE